MTHLQDALYHANKIIHHIDFPALVNISDTAKYMHALHMHASIFALLA